jgi:metallo-beta-lactamase family protein
MAIHATRIFMEHGEYHDLEMRTRNETGDDPLGLREVHLDSRVEDSKALNDIAYPAIVISASGMASGGRVLHHLAFKLPDHRTTVLFCGYQAAGTRGRALQEGAETVKIHGRSVRVRARVETLEGLSAHADRGEILEWVASAPRPPRRVHLVHGEAAAIEGLSALLREKRGIEAHVPDYEDRVDI